MQDLSNNLQKAYDTIADLYHKYENDEYMLTKTHNYICNQLPNVLENIRVTHQQRIERMEEMTLEQDAFINNFLSNNQYFYIPSTEKFFFYDGIHYQIYNEDDILYNVLSSISKDGQLMSWKQKTKIYIMKRIKQNNLLKSIPESETIQNVLSELYPTLFSTKTETKYFLTILGDNILKKNTDIIHIIDPKCKQFIRELTNLSQFIIGTNLSQSFKYKYHDNHEYSNCRLIKINNNIKYENVWVPLVNNSVLDLICVACHYSTRFNNSDDFIINHSNDNNIINRVFFLKDMQPVDMVNMFVEEYLQITPNSINNKNLSNTQIMIDNQSYIRATQITWKNMQYLWKHFLDNKDLPNIMFQQTLKGLLIDKLEEFYKDDLDSFIGICSKYLPAIQQFLQFWNENITYDENEMDFEIEEITILFKKWCGNKKEIIANLNDKQILDIITHYYPDIEIERDKYICKIRCALWDKQLDIQVALDNMKENIRMQYYKEHGCISNYERTSSPTSNKTISIYDMYKNYCIFFASVNGSQIVSKSYFEKYIIDNLAHYIVESKFISFDWVIV